MKKNYLALLLSVVVSFSSIPSITLNAEPGAVEQTVETTEATDTTTEDTGVTTESSESTSEETDEATESTEFTSKETDEATESTESTSEETDGTTESSESTSENISGTLEDSETISTEIEFSVSSESTESELSTEDAIIILEDTFTIQPSFESTVPYAAYKAGNSSLFQSDIYAAEDVSGVPYVEVKTLLQNEDAIRNQLSTDFELALYDAGKKSIVEKGYNYIKLTGQSEIHSGWEEPCNVISALAAAYPNKFNWINWTNASFSRQVTYYKKSKTYEYKYTLKKSTHYSSTLEKKADAKVKTLVTEANAYANEYYAESPAYGIIEYFNNWLCENNFFEKEHGTSTEESVQNGKIYYYSHSCYGPLLYGYGTSDGYALAMSRLLDAAGIRNMYVDGFYTADDPSMEYAWNYVEMPDGYWYIIDTIRNDNENNNNYLLIQIADSYEADSRKWKTIGSTELGTKIDYDSLIKAASGDYVPDTSETTQLESLSLNKETLVLKPGQTFQLTLTDSNEETGNYYNKFAKVWKNDPDNLKVAKVNKDGKVTAGSVPGKAVITVESANQILSCTVYVYQFTNIKFDTNNKTSYTSSYANPDAVFDEEDLQTVTLTVNQKNPLLNAQAVVSGNNLNEVTALSNKPQIAKVENVSLENDTITLKVLPKAVGSAKITITLAGKKASYTIKITQDLQEEWFDYSNITNVEYSGKSFKPSISLTEAGRDCSPKATHKITYTNNKNAGEAIITIKGTGKYSGTLTQTFTIFPKNISTAVFRSCTLSKTYNTKALAAATTVRLGKTTLKAGRDYTILYKCIDTASVNELPSDIIPTETGTYEVSIVGKGNYAGSLLETRNYTIKPGSIKKMSVSYRSAIKYTGEPVNALKSVKISGNILPPENYTITYLDNNNKEITEPVEKGKYTLVVTPIGGNVEPTLTKTCIKKKFTIK